MKKRVVHIILTLTMVHLFIVPSLAQDLYASRLIGSDYSKSMAHLDNSYISSTKLSFETKYQYENILNSSKSNQRINYYLELSFCELFKENDIYSIHEIILNFNRSIAKPYKFSFIENLNAANPNTYKYDYAIYSNLDNSKFDKRKKFKKIGNGVGIGLSALGVAMVVPFFAMDAATSGQTENSLAENLIKPGVILMCTGGLIILTVNVLDILGENK